MRHRGSILRQMAPKEAPRGTVQRTGVVDRGPVVFRTMYPEIPPRAPATTGSWSRRLQPFEIHSILPSPSGRGHICAPTSDNAGVRLTAASDRLPRAAPEQEVACSSPAGPTLEAPPRPSRASLQRQRGAVQCAARPFGTGARPSTKDASEVYLTREPTARAVISSPEGV
jgi:hypothetical protein